MNTRNSADIMAKTTQDRKTKIVCTIGPSCWSTDMLIQMIDAGMNVARLNFSHGSHEGHGNTLTNLRAALAERPRAQVAVMLDTKGPEIRTGFLKEGGSISLEKGQTLEICTDYEFLGDSTKIACSYKSLPTSVEPGQTILIADGSLVVTVTELRETSVLVEVMNSTKIGERKNMNLPGVVVDLPTITEKDEDDIVNFGLVENVDYIAASFVRKGSDIELIRETLGEAGKHIKIIAKIENQEGLDNFADILDKTDGIMVARGDLGMEIPPEKVFLAQKMMIRECNLAGKVVVTATQMLESMIVNPRPTRAECTDVANAVLDGTDCVMLSGETAGGSFPIAAVTMMSNICKEAENAIKYPELLDGIISAVLARGPTPTDEAIASSAVKTATAMGAKMLVVLTETGHTAQLVSKYRPKQPILVLTGAPETGRFVNGCIRGCLALTCGSMIGTDSILLRAIATGKELGWIQRGDCVVAVHGIREATSGATNMLKVLIAE